MQNFDGKTALITGGSSGIGLAMARRLAAQGADVWLLARDPRKLESACAEVSAARLRPNQQVRTIAADISDNSGLSTRLEPFLREHTPDVLVNCAGITYPGLFGTLDLAIYRQTMEINYFGTLHATRLIAPGMIERRSGTIINVNSLVGIHGLYGYAAYAASKFAQRGLSDALRYELKPHGIQVSIAFPSDTDTPQLAFEESLKPPALKALADANNKPAPADDVARRILDGAARGKYMIFPTNDARMLYLAYVLLPGDLFCRFVDGLMRKAHRQAAHNNGD